MFLKNKRGYLVFYLGVLNTAISFLPSVFVLAFYTKEIVADWFLMLATFAFISILDLGVSQFLYSRVGRPYKASRYVSKILPNVIFASALFVTPLLFFYLNSYIEPLGILFFLIGSFLRMEGNILSSAYIADGFVIKEKRIKIYQSFSFSILLLLNGVFFDNYSIEAICLLWFLSGAVVILERPAKDKIKQIRYSFKWKYYKLISTKNAVIISVSSLTGFFIFFAPIHYMKLNNYSPDEIVIYGFFLQGLNLLLQLSFVIYSLYAREIVNSITVLIRYMLVSTVYAFMVSVIAFFVIYFISPIILIYKNIVIDIEIAIPMTLLLFVELLQVSLARLLISLGDFNFISINIVSAVIIMLGFFISFKLYDAILWVLLAQFLMFVYMLLRFNKVIKRFC